MVVEGGQCAGAPLGVAPAGGLVLACNRLFDLAVTVGANSKNPPAPPTHILPAAAQPLPGVPPLPPTRRVRMSCVACQGGPTACLEESKVWDPGAHLGASEGVAAPHVMAAAVPLASMTAHLVADGCGEQPPHTPSVRTHRCASAAGAEGGLPCSPGLTGLALRVMLYCDWGNSHMALASLGGAGTP